MTNIQRISAAVGVTLLFGTTAVADDTSIQAGQWRCGTQKDSKTGYECEVITFRPGFGGNPTVYLAFGKLDLTGSGLEVLESIEVRVAQASWSSFQPEVDATGWADSGKTHHLVIHRAGNWGGTWIAVGPPLSEKH